MRLHWKHVQPGLHGEWITEEQLDGVPEFRIVRQGMDFRLKLRTSAQWTIHDSLSEAKTYAEGVWNR